MPADHYDVLVIGSGPGGATVAARVAETTKRALILERGDFLRRERDNWNSHAVFGDAKYTAGETFYDLHDRPFRPELHYYVGGNSKVFGAALFRLLPSDFGEVRHPDGVAPAWPLTYDDVEPYYVRAEHLFWVHGKHGEDPFAGFSSRDYEYPPVPHEPRIQRLSDDLEKLGLHPFHLPLGVRLTLDAAGRATTDSPCIRCDRVDGFPCLVGAKADAEQAVVRPALAAHPNLTLMTRTTVERLLTDASGRSVTGLAATLPDGSPHTFTADVVVLSAGAILSAALLLKSANDTYPHGLANSSDMVGRNYMRHNNLALIAFSREPNPTVFQKTLTLNDFYGPSEHCAYPMGNIQMLGKSDDWQIKGAAPCGLGWAPPLSYGQVAKHSVDFWLSSEDIPLADSRVTLRHDGTIRLALQPGNNTEGLTRLRRTFEGMLGQLGMVDTTSVRSRYLHKAFDAAATAHQAGTVRFGTDPASSALDVRCKAHDLDNLYVVDGSFMPSIGAVNPTLTIIANAHQRVMANRRFRPISRNGPVRLPDASGGVTAFKFRDHDGHPLELLAFPEGQVSGQWRTVDGTGRFLGLDHTAIAVSDSASSARFFGSVFGFRTGTRTENRRSEQADLDDVDGVHVSVTRLAPDLPAPRMELLNYHVGTRRPIPHDTASNDIVATHCVVRVASLDATAAALARRGTPLADDDLMILRGGIRAALVSEPDGHRFLAEESGGLSRQRLCRTFGGDGVSG